MSVFLIETRSLPKLRHRYLAALPSISVIPSSIETRSLPGLFAPTLVTLPSMSLIPFAPFLASRVPD